MSIIKPTIGRKVWFWPNGSHIGMPAAAQPECFNHTQAMDATVVCVWGDKMVNLLVIDHGGAVWPIRSVTLRQEGDDKPQGMYCEWMPYQTAQDKKDAQVGTAIARTMTFGAIKASIATENAIEQTIQVEELPLTGTDASIEQEIQAKGLTAPRVTPADIEANVAHTEIVKHVSKTGQVLRWAVITTTNGYAVVGNPSCSVSSSNDDQEIGEKVAIANTRQEMWPLMGYALKERLSHGI